MTLLAQQIQSLGRQNGWDAVLDQITNHISVVHWTPEDVQTLDPSMTHAKACEFLKKHRRTINDACRKVGWLVIGELIGQDYVQTQKKSEDTGES